MRSLDFSLFKCNFFILLSTIKIVKKTNKEKLYNLIEFNTILSGNLVNGFLYESLMRLFQWLLYSSDRISVNNTFIDRCLA